MGPGPKKVQAVIRNLEFLAPPPFPERAEGLKMESIIDHACVGKPPFRFQLHGVQGASRLVSTHAHWEGDTCHLHEDRSSCT